MMTYNLDRIAKDLVSSIEDDLQRIGIMHRIFFRCKEPESILHKMVTKSYDGEETFLRDIIGLRINVYFVDDLNIVGKIVKHRFEKMEEEVDSINATEFKPVRINYVFKIPEHHSKEFREIVVDKRVDCSFELQIRSVLSEGWHEVEHDLRYKQKDQWNDHQDLSRVFNGILASLETNDWSMLSMLDKLSHRHYKIDNWDAMIRTKVRLRIKNEHKLSPEIVQILDSNRHIGKKLYRIDRAKFLDELYTSNIRFPFTVDNIVYYLNKRYIGHEELNALIPGPLNASFSQIVQE